MNLYTRQVKVPLIHMSRHSPRNMDLILLKMALCELMHMPSIPIRVTMNEYIELAKYYSTPKSRIFINGVLDNALNMLRTENRMHKQGRGLMG